MRLFLLVVLLCLPSLSWSADWDGQPNRYRVRIDAQATRAEVEADLWQASDVLSMLNVMDVPWLANGQASLVDGLQATSSDGRTLELFISREPDATRTQRARFEAVFGRPSPVP